MCADAAGQDLAARLASAREPNHGAACTTAAVLTGLRALGAEGLPPLHSAAVELGARVPAGAPGLLDYVGVAGVRRAPLDARIEALAARHGLAVRCRTGPVLPVPASRLRPAPGEVLIAHLAWGQEAPGRRGAWGWHPLRPSTYMVGGHSVVVAAVERDGSWVVVDSNHPEVQRWARPGIALTATRLRPAVSVD
jgi:hypothetical protein